MLKVLQSLPRSRIDQDHMLTTTRQPQGLESLPNELLDAICSYLPIQSVIALHRTSINLSIKILLNTAFWRNCLRDGSLHPHIWDLDTKWIEQRLSEMHEVSLNITSSWDWNAAAKLLAKKRFLISGRDPRLVDVTNGFWNRCRIWSTIEEALQQQDIWRLEKERCNSRITIPKGTNAQDEKPA
jgi:hypothetical protein